MQIYLIYWLIKFNTSFDEVKYLVANRIKHFVFISIWYWGSIVPLWDSSLLSGSLLFWGLMSKLRISLSGYSGGNHQLGYQLSKSVKKKIAKCFYGLINLNTPFMVVCPAFKRILRYMKPSAYESCWSEHHDLEAVAGNHENLLGCSLCSSHLRGDEK